MKIVITGGPSAGKTSVVQILARSMEPTLAIVEEAAALLFRGGFPRHHGIGQARAQQIAIYHVQKQLETIAHLQTPKSHLVCDRGSLDGLAYWPGDESSFFESIGSSMEEELARYDYVIHLDTAFGDSYQKTDLRIENFEEAERINQRVKNAWAQHPHRKIVEANQDFLAKAETVVGLIRSTFHSPPEMTSSKRAYKQAYKRETTL